jgi:hypothetical protein
MDKLSNHATTIAADGDAMVVTYHRTQIVRFTDDTITLRMGGWDTVTTRRKMNQAAAQFRLPFSVYRDKGVTYARSTLTGESRPMDDSGPNYLPRKITAAPHGWDKVEA